MGQDYRNLFVAEAGEYLQRLEACLLELEDRPGDSEILDEMFRSAHSLKGMAATMGYTAMVTTAHTMEGMLQGVRDGERTITADDVDTIFSCIDHLRGMLDRPESALVGTGTELGATGDDRAGCEQTERSPELSLADEARAVMEAGQAVSVVRVSLGTDGAPAGAVDAVVEAVGRCGRVLGVLAEEDDRPDNGEISLVVAGSSSRELAGCLETQPGLKAFQVSGVEDPSLLQQQAAEGVDAGDGTSTREPEERLPEDGDPTATIRVRLAPGCQMKSVRAFMVLEAARRHGSVKGAEPSEEDLDAGEFEREFSIMMMGEVSEDLIEDIQSLSEIEMVEVIRSPEDDAGPNPFPEPEASAGSPAIDGEQAAAGKTERRMERSVRVETEKLDALINLVGEVVTSRTRVVDLSREMSSDDMISATDQLDRVVTDLQNSAMKLRMVAIRGVFERFPRMVRDLSRAHDKDARLVTSGEDTELDRIIVDQLSDPLVHLIRNSVDHGVETREERVRAGKPATATLGLRAHHEGSHVVITVSDDGRGLDAEAIQQAALSRGVVSHEEASKMTREEILELVFRPGFSTATEVTDVSGRGVGLDAVRQAVSDLSGTVEVRSTARRGTEFILRLPLTLAIIRVLLVRARHTYALPIETIRENLYVRHSDIRSVNQGQVIVLRDRVIPLLSMTRCLYDEDDEPRDVYPVVVLNGGGRRVAVIVDELVGQQEIVIKSLNRVVKGIRVIAGATVLGDGSVVLILDVPSLIGSTRRAVVSDGM